MELEDRTEISTSNPGRARKTIGAAERRDRTETRREGHGGIAYFLVDAGGGSTQLRTSRGRTGTETSNRPVFPSISLALTLNPNPPPALSEKTILLWAMLPYPPLLPHFLDLSSINCQHFRAGFAEEVLSHPRKQNGDTNP